MTKSAAIKTSGCAVSTVSIIPLAIVSLKSARRDPVLALWVASGVMALIIGMVLRWWSCRMDDHEQ